MIRRLVLPDHHWPDADIAVHKVMLDAAKDYKPHEIIILGDWFDVYCLSRFDKNPERVARDLEEELASGIDAIHEMMDFLKPRHLWFIGGNHDQARIEKYVNNNAPFIHKLIPPLHELFQLPRKSTLVPYGEFLKLDGVNYCHGIATGRNCTTKMLDMLSENIVMGHTHRAQMSSKRLLDGSVIKAYSMGWMGDFSKVDYVHHADWCHAFGTATTIGKRTDVQIHEVVNRGTILNCKEYDYQYKKTSR